MEISFLYSNLFDLVVCGPFLLHCLNRVNSTFVLGHHNLLVAARFGRIGSGALLFV